MRNILIKVRFTSFNYYKIKAKKERLIELTSCNTKPVDE